MLKIEGLRLLPGQGPRELVREAARLLRTEESRIKALHVLRRSIDARDGVELVYTAAVELADEEKLLRRLHRSRKVSRYIPPPPYALRFPTGSSTPAPGTPATVSFWSSSPPAARRRTSSSTPSPMWGPICSTSP